ncbi:hypothetical protein RHSIM_Rhsim10G0196900 [Rhododendron simsii]|uniref:Uncharacterized protein n=1 Tax=Rhododendron simsii TaxID=118357 RepID=A0A834GCX9_RHOSS|nr:hypothetical protein RHSIM_Rhsim10G0196900 [Rhododendron simsii]
MPEETGVPSLSSDRPTPSPYASTAETAARMNMLKKFVRSVYNKESMEEAKCLICMEPPHNAVILNCSNLYKGCRPYMCGTSDRLSNCLNHFLKSPSSTPTPSCPLCRGKVKKWIFISRFSRFMNSVPRSCSVETCEFIGNYLELENHASLEHPSVRPSVVDPVLMQDWRRLQCFIRFIIPRSCSFETCEFVGNYLELENHVSLEHPSVRPSVVDPIRMQIWRRFQRERDLGDRNLIASGSDFESVVAANEESDAVTARLESVMVDLPQHQVASRRDDTTRQIHEDR